MTSHDIDVVIVTYNSAAFLPMLSSTIAALPRLASVTIVDNGSVDGSRSAAHSCNWGPPATILERSDNPGFGAAINYAVASESALLRATYLLLVNPDVRVAPETVHEMQSVMEDDSEVAVVGAQLLRSDGSPVSSARKFPTLWSIARGRPSEVDHQGRTVPADWLCGALMLWRREAFDQVSGFDDSFFLYFEDIDICRRASKSGWKVMIAGGSTAIHDQGHGLPTSTSLIHANRCSRRIYARKWLGIAGLVAATGADVREKLKLLVRRGVG